MATKSITVPHANIKIEASDANVRTINLEKIDQVFTSFGFSLQENDWKVWEPILTSKQLTEKKKERRYMLDDLEIFYGVLYQSESNGYIRLSYYEHDKRQFSDSAISIYYQLKEALSNVGLTHLPETPKDIQTSRPVTSPEEFNNQHPLPPISEKIENAALYSAGILAYVAIIFVPVWFLFRIVISKLSLSKFSKRTIFVCLSTILIFPFPLPLSMFGPTLLTPGFIALPFVFGLPKQYISFVAISMSVTLVLSLLASVWLIKSSPNKLIQPTANASAD